MSTDDEIDAPARQADHVLSYAGPRPTGRKLWWGQARASRMALLFVGACAVAAVVDPSRINHSNGTYPGPIGMLGMLGAAFGTGFYIWRRLGEEPNVPMVYRMILFGAALATGPMTVLLYAALNPLRDGRRFARLWPDARGPALGLAACVLVFAAARLSLWWSRRNSTAAEPPPPPLP